MRSSVTRSAELRVGDGTVNKANKVATRKAIEACGKVGVSTRFRDSSRTATGQALLCRFGQEAKKIDRAHGRRERPNGASDGQVVQRHTTTSTGNREGLRWTLGYQKKSRA